ncbi:MAG TPA: DUF402 domain-containing protein [Ktedonobacterales bacterium]|nr:DUF402 domain-containing protein [Ktedonobacterales bacterium]
MSNITVHKLDTSGHVTVRYEAELAERLPTGVRLDARWARPPLALGYVTFEPGDRFVEWFFTDRWYNIFEIHAAAGDRLKGWYCNVTRPATITDSLVSAVDLLLDLWVATSGKTHTLDEDEFAADATLDEATRAAARAGLNELKRLARERAGPFAALRD